MERFEDIRPYNDEEIQVALKKIVSNSDFDAAVKYVFPEIPVEELKSNLLNCKTSREFQYGFMYQIIMSIYKKSTNGATYSGIENVDTNKRYLYVSNHRDIFLDSAILQIYLVDNNIDSSEIAFGDNLISSEITKVFAKVNKMFEIKRSGTNREILENTRILSDYIRHVITEKNRSVWIAQRSGRTKDGYDKSDPGLFKMFSLSSKKDFAENLSELNIIPVSISYEFEPCARYKTKENYISQKEQYVKDEDEDFNSIISGIVEPKGRLHLSIGKCINSDLLEIDKIDGNINNKLKEIASQLDKQVNKDYMLWPNNYVAYDILNKTDKYSDKYSSEEKDVFINYMTEELSKIEGEIEELKEIFLNIYSNPIVAKENL